MSSARRARRRGAVATPHLRHAASPSPILERRTLAPVQLEVTGADSPTLLTRIGGLAVPYNAPADIGPYVETFEPGAFADSISRAVNGLPLMLLHDGNRLPIGVSESFQDRAEGLHGAWRLDDSEEAQHAARLAENGILGYLSVRFAPIRSKWSRPAADPAHDAAGKDRVHRLEARLLEVSLVSMPAYAEAAITFVRHHPTPTTPPLGLSAWIAELDTIRSQSRA